MKYILKSTTAKAPANWVAPPGQKHSFTVKSCARRFDSREQAERNACGDEFVVEVAA